MGLAEHRGLTGCRVLAGCRGLEGCMRFEGHRVLTRVYRVSEWNMVLEACMVLGGLREHL